MATATSQAAISWSQATKTRKSIQKRLERLQADVGSGVDLSHFETIDSLLEKFRLGCVQAIFSDVKYAAKAGTEEALWDMHVAINAEYRRVLKRPKNNAHVVERRKADKMYHNFLRIAQKFYIGYVQRLSARYDIPELKRVAYGIDARQIASADSISPVPSDLGHLVLDSCHSTLLHLGDLARYRTQAKHRPSGYDMALTYYGLARHLMPRSGFAFHQIGIVHLDSGNHLDVVYNFYRSRAAEVPHPNAKSNLEAEFRTLRRPNSDKNRPKSSTPDPLGTWFIKLHARFYQGEPFSQQAELEEEIMHRLEMACRIPTSADMLLKMALINISAYEIASSLFAESMNESASRSSQFALRFNARFLSTLCRVLDSELRQAISDKEEPSSESAVVELPNVVVCLLPTLRVYCIWLGTRQQELFAAADAFGAVVPTLAQRLTDVFTLLCEITYGRQNLTLCPYLLPEDLEIRGVRPLAGEQVPERCRVFCDNAGALKPYLHDPSQRMDQEDFARVLDVLCCAYFLAEDCPSPIVCRAGKDRLIFEYKPVNKTPESRQPQARTSNALDRCNTMAEHSATDSDQGPATEDHAEMTVMAMLTPFLKPPTPQPGHHTRSPSESSYGMHTNTANDVFASAPGYATPKTMALSGLIAPYPWAWNDMPKPDLHQEAAASAGKAFIRANPNSSSRESMPAGFATNDDPFVTRTSADPILTAGSNFGLDVYPTWAGENAQRGQLPQSPAVNRIASKSPFTSGLGSSSMAGWNQVQGQPQWSPREYDQAVASSGTTYFSHPSSLYQGTPNNLGHGLSENGHSGSDQYHNATNDMNSSLHLSQAHTSESALAYDGSVFRRAQAGK
ncbi:hypothetical protein RJ55_01294 [Drechmeria coniospora]|nr:hypothetical protein RJ55_01294 [Drechmeria coniospora]